MEERLQKVLAQRGIASRRHAETLIEAGRVRVNGAIAHLGQKADPAHDRIELDGRLIATPTRPAHRYFLLHKPQRVVCSCEDPQGRKTVLAYLPRNLQRGTGLHPVGRLDFNSTGALLLTNDGDLTYRLTHPRHHVTKIYQVVVAGKPTATTLRQWQQGIYLSGRRTLPAQVKVLSTTESPHRTELELVLREGRNRQIRRVAEQLGHPVKKLHRLAIGPVRLGSLGVGKVRELTDVELSQLCVTPDDE